MLLYLFQLECYYILEAIKYVSYYTLIALINLTTSSFLVHFKLKILKVYFGEKYTLLCNAVMF